ncbi:MAG: SAM-dependent methyltransferase [Desulfobulbaceae bacterium A2]|nr:MAG: SAM-dependent methyltransferase [Desulfobulbaceae bacterium A2]
MKEHLLPHLICPACLPEEHALAVHIAARDDEDIRDGSLRCAQCGISYQIVDGVALLDPAGKDSDGGKYEKDEVLASYLWSHYADLLGDEHSSDAYQVWAGQLDHAPGLALDLGAAVGRLTFELGDKCALAVGLDKSVAFIRAARTLLREGQMTVRLKEEGRLFREELIRLPPAWRGQQVEFIVADALRLPFRAGAAGTIASLNLVDKVPDPLGHLREIQRVARPVGAQLLISDPFSWSEETAAVEHWLGGQPDGPFHGYGLDNIKKLLCHSGNGFTPVWREGGDGQVWWKIRTHRNHYELIRSCYLKVTR